MLIKGVHIENAAETSDIRVTGGKFEEIAPSLAPRPGEEVVDCTGKLALPPCVLLGFKGPAPWQSSWSYSGCLTLERPRAQ